MFWCWLSLYLQFCAFFFHVPIKALHIQWGTNKMYRQQRNGQRSRERVNILCGTRKRTIIFWLRKMFSLCTLKIYQTNSVTTECKHCTFTTWILTVVLTTPQMYNTTWFHYFLYQFCIKKGEETLYFTDTWYQGDTFTTDCSNFLWTRFLISNFSCSTRFKNEMITN